MAANGAAHRCGSVRSAAHSRHNERASSSSNSNTLTAASIKEILNEELKRGLENVQVRLFELSAKLETSNVQLDSQLKELSSSIHQVKAGLAEAKAEFKSDINLLETSLQQTNMAAIEGTVERAEKGEGVGVVYKCSKGTCAYTFVV